MTVRTALYLRQSLDRTGEALAVERQRRDCRKLAKTKGWDTVTEYVDNDVSASNGKPRPQYQRLLADVRAGRLDAVIAWAPDRLLRRPIELEELLDLVEQRGLLVATVAGGDYDLSTPYGRAVARIFGAIARQEVEQKGARQARANLQRAEAGQTSFTRRPFGYSADGRSLVEAEADEVRQAASAVLDGATLASLVNDLNNRGVRTSTGGRWTVTTLRRILLNPRYAGLATYRGKVTTKGLWPAVYDREVHERLVLILTNPARLRHKGTTPRYLLSGLARCGLCGDRMFASPMGQKGEYWMVYRCRKAHLMRRLDRVDEIVTDVVVARLAAPDAVDLLATENEDVTSLRAEGLRLRQQIDDLADMFAEGHITSEGLKRNSAKLRARLDDVERRCVPSSGAAELLPLLTAKDVGESWGQLPLARKRGVIDLLMDVTVLPAGKGTRFSADQVRIVWREQG
jgi:DNA invertase Pin-like site-specific DNA recombinase